LYLTNSTPTVSTFGSANSAVTQVTASGGVGPYTYSLPGAFTTATGISINATTGIVGTTSATLAGSYSLVVTATDSTSGTPIQGTLTFTIVVNLNEVTAATSTTFHVGVTAGAANTMTTTGGGTGTLTYSLDPATAALVSSGLLTFDSTTGLVSVTTNAPIMSTTVIVTVTNGSTPADGSAVGTASQSFALAIVQ
jgi:hypothetical protein